MSIIVTLFFFSLVWGQIVVFSLSPGVHIFAHDVMLVLLLSLGFAKSAQKSPSRPLLCWGVCLFVSAAALSLVVNAWRFSWEELSLSSLYLVRWALYALVYFVILRLSFPAVFWLKRLYGASLLFVLVGFGQYLLYPDLRNLSYLGWDPHYMRLFSTFLDPNFAGIFIVLSFLLSFWPGVSHIGSIAGGIIRASFVVAIVLTFSRSTYAAIAASALTYIGLTRRWRMLVVLLIFVLFMVFMPKPGGDTLRLFRMDSTISRLNNWKEAVGYMEKSPLVGLGFNAIRYVRQRELPANLYPEDGVSHAASGFDNSFLFVGVTAGLLGLCAYIFLLLQAVNLGHLLIEKKLQMIGVLTIASIMAVVIHGMFLNTLFYPWVMIWLWVVLGAAERELVSKK